MKKQLFAIILVLTILLSLTACNGGEVSSAPVNGSADFNPDASITTAADISTTTATTLAAVTSTDSTGKETENPSQTAIQKKTSRPSTSKKITVPTFVKPTAQPSAAKTTTTTAPVAQPNQPSSGNEESVNWNSYKIDGKIKDWCVQGEKLYVVFTGANVFCAFDVSAGALLKQAYLPLRPAEIQYINNELWVSYPDGKCIRVYDPVTFAEKRIIRLPQIVSSFAVYGDYIFFAEDNQHVRAFRYNMKTAELDELLAADWHGFFYADIAINPADNLVYVGDVSSTGCIVRAYDMDTLEAKSLFIYNDYGYINHARRSFVVDGDLYWGEFCLRGDDISCVERQYSAKNIAWGGMLWVDANAVVTMNGIFDRITCQQIATLEGNIGAAAFTPTGNMMLWDEMESLLYLFRGTE